MLEKISASDGEETADIFTATYGEDNNWATIGLAIDESGELYECECVASEVSNNAGIDLNMFLFYYGYFEEVDYAILCGLIPSTPNLLESVEEEIMIEPTVNEENGKVTSVKITGEGNKEYSFDY